MSNKVFNINYSLAKAQILANPHQTTISRVLCVCSGGILRSATASHILASEPYDLNTRACGIYESALIQVDRYLVAWSDIILCMEDKHKRYLTANFSTELPPKVFVLDIPDRFQYRDPVLVELIKERWENVLETICMEKLK